MTRLSSLAFALLIFTAFGLQVASAQITFKIPEVPRVKKPKAEPPRAGGGESAPAPTAGTSAPDSDQPTVAKDSIQVKATTNSSYRKDFFTQLRSTNRSCCDLASEVTFEAKPSEVPTS